ncbi:sigma-54-dependent Fis family transcriptional regulator [Alginatibacterium sediminis]|uniref:Sigma-54-dependent Fis family transcriptional regulator n=1 Tax=Alginatibacterium sediminis TaxID=2164068 RepID=A0A420E999_9ALTE|nr:sigma-54 dependent transcriptional regulator [Alginatibacterium sediminis]RKF15874.1 sigma-54-dependent Fis family transcriptional regulator [Alginatibacterium sediminis]
MTQSTSKCPIILVDDDPDILLSLQQTLSLEDYDCQGFESALDALNKIDRYWPGVIITDINMPYMNGLEFLRAIQSIDPQLQVIVLTGHGDIELAVKAMREGAYDFLEKPFATRKLIEVIERAADKRRLVFENRDLRDELAAQSGPGPRILGQSPAIRQLKQVLNRIKDAPADVLIHAETGCGKDLVARFLHDHSHRAKAPFVAINCGAIPEAMIESELFGHEAGAFTGANKKRIGKIAYADGGTLFLDEIESMPMALQIKLLRVLEERQVEPLGSNKVVDLNIRVIAASKVDLLKLSQSDDFRNDLYYRLNVVQVSIPPLRERVEDIPLLLENFMRVAAARYQLPCPEPSAQRIAILKQHPWPGNVRELRNLAERWILMGESTAFNDETHSAQTKQMSLQEQMARFEKTVIQDALNTHRGRLKPIQQELDLARKTLYEKMKKYQLEKQDFKTDA